MTDNYAMIVRENIKALFEKRSEMDILRCLPSRKEGDAYAFDAFGETCRIRRDGIFLGEEPQEGPMGIVLSLYALHARPFECVLEPLKAFKDFQGSMPYVAAFAANTQNLLVPHVDRIQEKSKEIITTLDGQKVFSDIGGDFSFMVRPVPKITLSYIIYEADEDFPASVTCLFSNNAPAFLPLDGLADLGEYTSRKILEIVES
ncbi:MAG: DUF3786 domain-containing protein [Thermodesulfobacteriota bacterium]